jgi:hypothetical protein
MIQNGLANMLSHLLAIATPDAPFAVPVVRAIGHLTSGPVHWIVLLTEAAAHIRLCELIDVTHGGPVLQEGTWALSNFTGCVEVREQVVTPRSVELCVRLALSDVFEVSREGIFAVSNVCVDPDVCAHVVRAHSELLPHCLSVVSRNDEAVTRRALLLLLTAVRLEPALSRQVLSRSHNRLVDFLTAGDSACSTSGDGDLLAMASRLLLMLNSSKHSLGVVEGQEVNES